MSELFLSPESVLEVEKHDPLFARELDESRRGFLHLLMLTPGYLKVVTDQMQPDDLYRAVIPKEVLGQLQQGDYEKILKQGSGLWNGMIRRTDGRRVIVSQAEWEKVQLDRNALVNLHQIALQASIAAVTQQLLAMDRKLDLILTGQHADRVSKVRAGIDLYETAHLYKNSARRDQQLMNALQSLNEGRRALFGELESMLAHQKREGEFLDRLWRVIGVDKPEVEFFKRLEKDRPRVAESIKYTNLSSAYIFRLHVLVDEQEAAEQSKRQYVEFCDLVLGKIREEDSLHPHELVEATRGFRQLGQRARSLTDAQRDLVIEARYEELKHAEV